MMRIPTTRGFRLLLIHVVAASLLLLVCPVVHAAPLEWRIFGTTGSGSGFVGLPPILTGLDFEVRIFLDTLLSTGGPAMPHSEIDFGDAFGGLIIHESIPPLDPLFVTFRLVEYFGSFTPLPGKITGINLQQFAGLSTTKQFITFGPGFEVMVPDPFHPSPIALRPASGSLTIGDFAGDFLLHGSVTGFSAELLVPEDGSTVLFLTIALVVLAGAGLLRRRYEG